MMFNEFEKYRGEGGTDQTNEWQEVSGWWQMSFDYVPLATRNMPQS